jgi:hypothetical protein
MAVTATFDQRFAVHLIKTVSAGKSDSQEPFSQGRVGPSRSLLVEVPILRVKLQSPQCAGLYGRDHLPRCTVMAASIRDGSTRDLM